LNSNLLSAYGGLVSAYTETGKTQEAYEMVQKVLAINPNSPDGHFFLGYLYRYAGFLDRAEQEMEKALTLDPNNPRFRSIGITYTYLGKYQQALSGCDIDSASTFSLSWKANIYILAGHSDSARPYLDRVLAIEPESRLGLFCREMKLYIDKRSDLLAAIVRKSEEAGVFDGESWYNLSEQLGRFGDAAGVARTLRKAIDGGFFNYPLMLRDPFFESVRENQEVREVMGRAKEKFEAFKARHPELWDAK
jgi:tetratricopeptide (TPR) repeat protein